MEKTARFELFLLLGIFSWLPTVFQSLFYFNQDFFKRNTVTGVYCCSYMLVIGEGF